jgi:Mn2+/Fe2+ NRAMP family transporter
MRVAVSPSQTRSAAISSESTLTANDPDGQLVEYVNMANGWTMAIIGWLVWMFIAGLNVYLIVMLGMGK